jgi:hypothetical protein
VFDGMSADVMLVIATDERGVRVCALCDLAQSAVTRRPVETIDPSRPAAQIRFEGARAEALPQGDDCRLATPA